MACLSIRKDLQKHTKNLQKGNQYCQLTKNLCLLAEKKNVIMNTMAQPSPIKVWFNTFWMDTTQLDEELSAYNGKLLLLSYTMLLLH